MPLKLDRNLAQRLATGLIVGPLVLWVVYRGELAFLVLAALAASVATVEFYRLLDLPRRALWIGLPAAGILTLAGQTGSAVMGAAALSATFLTGLLCCGLRRRALLIPGAALYIGVPLALCLAIRGMPLGIMWAFTVIVANWGTDSLAYICGHLFGRHPLAPTISPNKTIEGAMGGLLGGIGVGVMLNLAAGSLSWRSAGVAALAALGTILGDLFESALKRRADAKDAGSILPGHGGILDRIDGLIVACVLVWVFLTVVGG